MKGNGKAQGRKEKTLRKTGTTDDVFLIQANGQKLTDNGRLTTNLTN